MRIAALSFVLSIMALSAGPAVAQNDPSHAGGLDRSVRIIDRDAPPQGVATSPAETGPSAGPLPVGPTLKNTVGLTFDVLPGPEIRIGSKMSFRVSAKKAGYILLVDIDATGKTTQIYPNFLSTETGGAKGAEENRIAAGAPVEIPVRGSKAYEFVASQPAGIGMVVAIFSETPLQVIDLPDVPPNLVGRGDAAGFVRDAAGGLQFIAADGNTSAKNPNLSFEARFYALK